MAKINFEELSEEQIAALEGKDLEAYNKYLAKKDAKPEPKAIGVYRDPKTREVIDLVLPFPNPKNPKEIAANYFVEHEQYTLDEVIVCDDGVVFAGTQKGQNGAANYCTAKGIGQHTFSR